MNGRVVMGLCPTVNGMNVVALFQLTAYSSPAIESSPKLNNEEEDVRLVEVVACWPGKDFVFLPFWLSSVEKHITFPAGMSVNSGKSDASLLPAIITRLADEG